MKSNRMLQKWLGATAFSLIVAGVATSGFAQSGSTNNPNHFNTSADLTSMVVWWGPPNPTVTWDGTLDAAGDSGSGSARYVENFTTAVDEQFMTHFTIANRWQWDNGTVIDGTLCTNIQFDIKVDPSSSPTVQGNSYGNLTVGLTTLDSWDNRIYPPAYNIPLTATNWTHVNIPVNIAWDHLEQVVGFFVNMWSGADHTNTLIFNIDNVELQKPAVAVSNPPPTMELVKAASGLKLFATTSAGANGRQNIHPLNSSYSWGSAGGPVSFKITIKDYPAAPPTGLQTHLFLAPATDIPYGPDDTSVDWNSTNLVFVQIQNTPGGGQVRFMYKTNVTSTSDRWDGQIFGSNTLAQIDSTTMKGTWTVTFTDATHISLIAPDNTTTNFTMPAPSAALFSGPVYAWFGLQANGTDKLGKSAIIDRIQITGFPADNIDDSFTGPGIDTGVWKVAAADNAGVQVVSPSTAYWLHWSVPDAGFALQSGTSLSSANWSDPGLTATLIDGKKRVQIPTSLSSSNAFFRLIKRQFAKLQILLPGETAAPGTPTGKTGTPSTQAANVPFNVTVRAVSADWYPITGINDTIHFTSTDGTAFLPPDGPLSNGTGTFSMFFGADGSYTVTASDATDGTKTSDTSSSVTVTP